jgi:hypothetical protein
MDFQQTPLQCEFCLNFFDSSSCILPSAALKELDLISNRRRKYSILLEAHKAITKEYETSTASLTNFVKDRVYSTLMSTAQFEEIPTPLVDVGTEPPSPSVTSYDSSQIATPQTARSLSPHEKAALKSSPPSLAHKTSAACTSDDLANSVNVQNQTHPLDPKELPICRPHDIVLSTSILELMRTASPTKLALSEFVTSFKAQLDALSTKLPLHEKHFHKRDKILNLIFNVVISSHTVDGSLHRYHERHLQLTNNSACLIAHIVLSKTGRNQTTMQFPQDLFTTFLSKVKLGQTPNDSKLLDSIGSPRSDQELADASSLEPANAPPLAARQEDDDYPTIDILSLAPLKALHQMRTVPGHTCPNISPILETTLENQLIGLTTRLLNEEPTFHPSPNKIDGLSRLMICLTFEIVSHNIKWSKNHYILSRSTLDSASRNLTLDTSKEELSLVFPHMSNLLSQLRTKLPLRHFT